MEESQGYIQTMPLWSTHRDFERFRESCLPRHPILSLKQLADLETFANNLTYGIVARNSDNGDRVTSCSLVRLVMAIEFKISNPEADLRPQLAKIEDTLAETTEHKDFQQVIAHVRAA